MFSEFPLEMEDISKTPPANHLCKLSDNGKKLPEANAQLCYLCEWTMRTYKLR